MAIIDPQSGVPLGNDHLKVHDIIRADSSAGDQSLWVDENGDVNTQAGGAYIGEYFIARDSASNELNIASIDASNEINIGDNNYDVKFHASNDFYFDADIDLQSNAISNATGLISQWTNDSSYELQSNKGTALGYASLDGGGKVPVTQLPSAIMIYKGTWNATTNSPTLVDGTGDTGDVYRVSVAGTQDLGSGSISFSVGDYCIYNGTIWEKSDTTDAVDSVNGYTGTVQLDHADLNTILGDGEYHLDSATESALTDANAQLSALHTDGTPTFASIGIGGTPDQLLTLINTSSYPVIKLNRDQALNDGDTAGFIQAYGDNGTTSEFLGGIQIGADDISNGAGFVKIRIGNNTTGNFDAVTVNSSGNIGFNTSTLSNWASTSGAYAIQGPYGQAFMFLSNTQQMDILSNAYYQNAYKRYAASEASDIALTNDGRILFRVAGSDSADSIISWTKALEIDNDGIASFSDKVSIGGADTGGILNIRGSNSQIHIEDSESDKIWGIESQGDSNLAILEDASDKRLVIQAGGNIGFNTTDIEDVASGYKALQFPVANIRYGNTSPNFFISNNAYYDGEWKRRIEDTVAQLFLHTDGYAQFRTAVSDSEDSTISWVYGAKFNNDGTTTFGNDVGIGGTPDQRLHVQNSSSGVYALIDCTYTGNTAIAALELDSGTVGVNNKAAYLFFTRDGERYGRISMTPKDNTTDAEYAELRLGTINNGSLADTLYLYNNNVGIGMTPVNKFDIKADGGGSFCKMYSSSDVERLQIYNDESVGDHGVSLVMRDASSNAVVIESRPGRDSYFNNGGGVIVGGANQVSDYALTVGSGSGNAKIGIYASSGSQSHLVFADDTSGVGSTVGRIVYDHSENRVSIFTNSSEAMRINSSGNIGFSTTSIEDWNSNFRAIEAYQCAIMMSKQNTSGLFLLQNAYYDGDWKYKTGSVAASSYGIANGNHYFRVATGGSADATITWNEALKIDYNGIATFNSVEVDSTSDGRFSSYNSSASSIGNSADYAFNLKNNASEKIKYGFISVKSSVVTDGNESGAMRFFTYKDGSSGQRWEINADGDLVSSAGSLITDTVRAIDGDGLELFDDDGNGLIIADGGDATFSDTVNVLDPRYVKGQCGNRLDDQTIYVNSSVGDDDNDGTSGSPLETIAEAVLRAQYGGRCRIYLRSEQTFQLTSDITIRSNIKFYKSGTGDNPLIDLNGNRFTIEGGNNLFIYYCDVDADVSGSSGDSLGMFRLQYGASMVAFYCYFIGDGTNPIFGFSNGFASIGLNGVTVSGDSGSSVTAYTISNGGSFTYNSNGGSWSNYTEPSKGTIITS